MTFYSDVNRQDLFVDPKLYDLEAVYQSIDSILNTQKGERLFLPEFGVDLEKYLFEPLTYTTETLLFAEIYNALHTFEPRIEIDRGESFLSSDPISHEVEITLVFSIKGKKFEEYVYQTKLTENQKEKYYEL